MNTQNQSQDLDQIYQIIKSKIKSPIKIQKYNQNTIIITYNNTYLIEILKNKNNQIEFKPQINKRVEFNPNNIRVIEILIQILKKNNINILYNELLLKQVQENHSLQTNPNYIHTENTQEKCHDANTYFYKIFNKNSLQYKKGILIYHNKILIGVLKLVPKTIFDFHFDNEIEQKTILSFKLPNNNVPLEEFMIYNTDKKTYLKIKDKIDVYKIYEKSIFTRLFKNKWTKINFTGQFPINKSYKRSLFNNTQIEEKFKNKIEYTYNENKNKTNFDAEINLDETN